MQLSFSKQLKLPTQNKIILNVGSTVIFNYTVYQVF